MKSEIWQSIFKTFSGRREGIGDNGETSAGVNRIFGNISSAKETILLVDDEDVVRGVARQILEASGYTVFEAKNGSDALAICEHSGDRIELLLTDVIMPVMGGRLLAEKIATRFPAICILFMSGYTDDAPLRQGEAKKTINFIRKPFTPEALELKVKEILENRS